MFASNGEVPSCLTSNENAVWNCVIKEMHMIESFLTWFYLYGCSWHIDWTVFGMIIFSADSCSETCIGGDTEWGKGFAESRRWSHYSCVWLLVEQTTPIGV